MKPGIMQFIKDSYDTGLFGPGTPIHWPEVSDLPLGPEYPNEPSDYLPDPVHEYIVGMEYLAKDLRRAAEVHYMRRQWPGWRNRAWRKANSTTAAELILELWSTDIEYET